MPVILARASQQAAGYRPEGGVERCGYCRFFVSQGTCNRILGPVSPRVLTNTEMQQVTT